LQKDWLITNAKFTIKIQLNQCPALLVAAKNSIKKPKINYPPHSVATI